MEPNTIIGGKLTNYPTGSSYGVTVTASASTNTKGSYAEISASINENCSGFYVSIFSVATAVVKALIDIAIGAGGSELIILSNIQYQAGHLAARGLLHFYVPIPIVAGTRFSARMQSSVGSKTVTVAILPITGGAWFMPRLGKATTYGADTSDSTTAQIDPGAVANTKGAYTQLSASITYPIRWLIILAGDQGNILTRSNSWKVDVAIGAAASEMIMLQDIPFRMSSDSTAMCPMAHCFPVSIPSGSRLAVRAQNTDADATDRLFDCSIIGVS